MRPDSFELALTATVAAGLGLAATRVVPLLSKFARHTLWCMAALAILPVALRLALLPRAPVPIPATADDTSYVLLAGTLAHFRLANPPHAFHRFFETNFVIQEPTYSSIFPIGPAIPMALTKLIFGHPWPGVLLAESLFCALCYWMLRGWVSPGWALAGGVLAVCEFGPLSYWMNSYWGGAVSGIAGCLLFGAIPRRSWTLAGIGLGIQLLSRPFEFVLLTIAAVAFWISAKHWRGLWKTGIGLAPATLLLLLHNHAVTGKWTTLPYQLSRAQYGSPTTFTFQMNPKPSRELSQEQSDNYDAQSAVHERESRKPFFKRLADRRSWVRFFVLPPLYMALAGFVLALSDLQMKLALGSVAVFALGTNFYPYFYPHYAAAVACVFLLMVVIGLDRIGRLSPRAAVVIFVLAVAHFGFWYGLHLGASDQTLAAMLPYETSDYINRGDPEGRAAILKQLNQAPGRQLVFVRFAPQHPLREWIGNEADIDKSRIVWALDRGRTEDAILRKYYQDRRTWLLEPDDHPPRLTPYPELPVLHFEEVR